MVRNQMSGTHMLRILMYVGERSIYGMKLVTICAGSIANTLEKRYTRTA